MIKKILLLILCTIISYPAHAELKIRKFGNTIYVDECTVSELEKLYAKNNYKRFHALPNHQYPSIILKKLPSDFTEIPSQKYRNELFIRILAPLALKINEEFENDRQTLLRIEREYSKNKKLSSYSSQKLENLAAKYDYFTRQTGNTRQEIQIINLKKRVDIVPPSVLIATAAIETNWGTSRLVKEANSLYKEKLWFTNEGLEPLENKNDGYRFKIFNSLRESMQQFALKFNSNINFKTAWKSRSELRKRHSIILGESIAYSLSISSNLPNYAGILEYTTAFYDLYDIDLGSLKRGISE